MMYAKKPAKPSKKGSGKPKGGKKGPSKPKASPKKPGKMFPNYGGTSFA